jgi:hypothetical protein
VPAVDELVAAGACVQAAAVLHEPPPGDVAAAWSSGRGSTTEPSPASGAARDEIRARYRERRDVEVKADQPPTRVL